MNETLQGVVIGLLLALLCEIIEQRLAPSARPIATLERALRSKLGPTTAEKAEIQPATSDETSAWLASLPEQGPTTATLGDDTD